jgi:hypothetical protein
MFRIDDLDLTACRLPKIDVEGAEPAPMKGCVDAIGKNRPFLFIECNECCDADAIFGAVEVFDYDLWWHIDGYFSPVNYLGNPADVFERYHPEANLFWAPRESKRPVGRLVPCMALATIGAPPPTASRQNQHSSGLKAAASRGTSK